MSVATIPLESADSFPFKIEPTSNSIGVGGFSDTSVVLKGEFASGWELVQELTVLIEREDDGSYIASDDKFATYGVGDRKSEALEDYRVSLIDYYELVEHRADDNEHAARVFHQIRSYIQRVDH